MKIADHEIGPGAPLFLVAELGVTSGGDLARALALVDVVADSGCHAAKFVVTDPDAIMASRDVMFGFEAMAPQSALRVMETGQTHAPVRREGRIYDLLKETVFALEDWRVIRDYCHSRGVIFFATADHLGAVAMLEALNVPAHKVSAWDIAYLPLIQAMRATGKPVLVDVGTCTREELLRAIPDEQNLLYVHDPHPPDWNLGRLVGFFRPDYPVGFASPGRESWCDHVALGAGACLIEKRLTLRRGEATGHHHAISLEPDEFRDWVQQMTRVDALRREDPFAMSEAARAERGKYDRGPDGRRP